jgi:Putative prokaryotic signal transducing protein
MSDDLVVARTFNTRPEAELARSALDAAGIDAMVRADSGGDMRPAIAWAGDGFQVIVRADDLEVAREILDLPARPELR